MQRAIEAVVVGGIGGAVGGSRHCAVSRIAGPILAHVMIPKNNMPGHLQ